MTLAPRLLGLVLVTLVAAPALAGPVKTVKGRVLHDPLGIDDEDAAGVTYPAWLSEILSEPNLEGQPATLFVRDRQAIAVSARTVADAPLTTAQGTQTLLADTRILIVGVHEGQYRVTTVASRRVRGLMSPAQVRAGNVPSFGDRIGRFLAPVLALGTRTRNARVFHPDGHTFRAKVTPILSGEFDATARKLEGQALVRMGGGIWRQRADGGNSGLWDTLSLAIRFTSNDHALDSTVREGDQDLLVASWSERFHHFFWRSLPKTNQHDFLDNDYFPAMPYKVDGKPVWLRVIPVRAESEGKNRIEKFRDAIKRGKARYFLEIQHAEQERWHRVARLDFTNEVDVDQEELKYHPHMDGVGITPTGTISAIRARVYQRSQAQRDAARAEREAASEGLKGALQEQNSDD